MSVFEDFFLLHLRVKKIVYVHTFMHFVCEEENKNNKIRRHIRKEAKKET